MAGKRAKPKLVPDAPDLPAQFDRAPARLDRPARWEGVHADADVQAPSWYPMSRSVRVFGSPPISLAGI
jgi:hypothetical protein